MARPVRRRARASAHAPSRSLRSRRRSLPRTSSSRLSRPPHSLEASSLERLSGRRSYSGGVFNGLTPDKLVIIAIVAVFVLGPERLPHYATQLARLVKSVREMANGARDRMREELGDDFDDLDWK